MKAGELCYTHIGKRIKFSSQYATVEGVLDAYAAEIGDTYTQRMPSGEPSYVWHSIELYLTIKGVGKVEVSAETEVLFI